MIVLGGEEGLQYEDCVGGMRLEHMLEFKYLGFVLMIEVQMKQSEVGMWRVGGGLQVLLA